jgi:oligopeptide transport system substrate-binding protein
MFSLSTFSKLVFNRGAALRASVCILITIIMLQSFALAEPFRFHIQEEPLSLDPAHSHLTVASWVLNLLHAPLMLYQDQKLVPWGASRCEFKTTRLVECCLRKDWLWSDGNAVKADEILAAVQNVFSEKSSRVNNFLNIKNARKILAGQLKVKSLGVHTSHSSDGTDTISFELEKPDAEFLYRLIDPAVSPHRNSANGFSSGLVASGPYVFVKRQPGRSLLFTTNKNFFVHADRPDVEAMVVDSDDTALRMFEKGGLNLHRRVPPDAVKEYQTRPGFFWRPLLRFDYLGLGPATASDKLLRQNIAASVVRQSKDYEKLFIVGPTGCVSLTKDILASPVCMDSTIVAEETPHIPLALEVSNQGAIIVTRQAELFREGWKKNLNLDVEIRTVELGQLENELRHSPPAIFRRGVNLERPTCLAALELFESGSANNFVGFNDPTYDAILQKMREPQSPAKRSALCAEAIKKLYASALVIPLSESRFPMVSDQKFDGFRINELGQLDLSRLHANSTKAK